MNAELHQYLIEVARDQGYRRYREIGERFALDMNRPEDRNEISRLLDEVSEYEASQGNPLLSAVVIHADDNMPGNGFFEMAQRMGRFSDGDRLEFWLREIRAVHDFWSAESSA